MVDIVNKVHLGDAYEVLQSFPDNFVQTIITSPIYFSNDRWKNEELDFYLARHQKIFAECFRVLREDGTLFLNINDHYVQSEGQYLNVPAKYDYFLRVIGYYQPQKPIIWLKDTALVPKNKLQDIWEYVFIYSKSKNPKFDKDKIQVPAKYNKDRRLDKTGTATKACPNVWEINKVFADGRTYVKKHSCPFPEKLVENCITLSTDENDVVLDVFSGAGTVCYVAKNMNRKYIGIEIDKDYYEDSLRNIELSSTVHKTDLFFGIKQPKIFGI